MIDSDYDLELLEPLLEELINELLNQKNPMVSNPPTPSLNDFSQFDISNIDISEKELDKLLDILKEINLKLEAQEARERTGGERRVSKRGRSQENEFERELIHNLKEELKAELKNELREELLKQKEDDIFINNYNNSGDSYIFKDELAKHAENFDFVELTVISGSDCCKIVGILCEVYSDFIVLITEDNSRIKISISKIVSVRLRNDGGRRNRYSEDDDNLDYEVNSIKSDDNFSSKEENKDKEIAAKKEEDLADSSSIEEEQEVEDDDIDSDSGQKSEMERKLKVL
ncbi:hypothetical protein BX659_12061 [Orenia metallireducens]|jgi:hypothetical protein|uniref:Uncharacterized protein n=1 Tax=Orenia metallireducens TaxID=1413210 RepID=A0A285GZX8_9FIRM|nr:hypothetical protein [Orenia metallireducens]PRX26470.1 hypothetical protein BX659_12061 [Orenia metallireducens]SNY28844.1 hypothetical protein SAMN06265827_11261 [Orenia metallireducens]